MERATSRALLCLSLFLVLLPLVLEKPGWPAGLKSDEPAYYLMALSLAYDRDLEVEPHDLRRLFDEFPYHPVRNLILATDDGWHTVYFGKPYIYSLFAAPAARLFGASGMVAFNMALTMLMVWLGAWFLRRHNRDATAALFSAGFFLASAGAGYVFWIQPEVFNMTAIAVCLYLGLTEGDSRRFHGRWARLLASPELRCLGSGAALALAAYNKPMLGLLGLPVLFACWQRRRPRALGAWILGAALSAALVMGLAMALFGHPSAYLGMTRGGQQICSPHEIPVEPAAPPAAPPAASPATAPLPSAPPAAAAVETAAVAKDPPRASWYWMFRIPRFHPPEVLENLGYFLWGRHTGLFLYFPFSLLAVALFLLHRRRSAAGWVLLGSLAAVAAVFLLWIPYNWQGGGGFFGNRYYVNAYPGFLFLVGRIAPAGILALGYALGGLLLGPSLLTPMGRSIPWPTLQAHVRNFPFPLFPLEHSLREIPGYLTERYAGARLKARRDQVQLRGGRFWVHGASTVEIWIQRTEPIESFTFHVQSFAAPNDVRLRLGSAEQRLHFPQGAAPAPRQVLLAPEGPTRVRSVRGTPVYAYRLEVLTRHGEVRPWTRLFPPQDCTYFPAATAQQESFYVGAVLAYMGAPERVNKDLYAVEWGEPGVPPRVAAGETFTVETRVRNVSGETWPADMPTRVALAYRWESAAGEVVEANGLRTYLETEVPPGGLVVMPQQVLAPPEPGRYTLTLDLVYELVAWFSWKNDGDVYRVPVDVAPAPEK